MESLFTLTPLDHRVIHFPDAGRTFFRHAMLKMELPRRDVHFFVHCDEDRPTLTGIVVTPKTDDDPLTPVGAAVAEFDTQLMREIVLSAASLPTDEDDAAAAHGGSDLVRALSSLRPRLRRRMTREHLERVAQVYRAGLVASKAPVQYLSEHYDPAYTVPLGTAKRWIREARSQGLLGPTTPRRAGEAA